MIFSFFFLEKKFFPVYRVNPGCDMRGFSGALLPEIRFMRGRIPSQGLAGEGDMLTGRRATGYYEPRQVRKEAAISKPACVVDRSRFCCIFFP